MNTAMNSWNYLNVCIFLSFEWNESLLLLLLLWLLFPAERILCDELIDCWLCWLWLLLLWLSEDDKWFDLVFERFELWFVVVVECGSWFVFVVEFVELAN